MPKLKYNWKRFWCARDKRIVLSDDGFLSDRQVSSVEYDDFYSMTLNVLSDIPCLALLGETGMGKSFALHDEYLVSKSSIKKQGNISLFFDLGQYGSEDRLVKDIFEADEVLTWTDNDNHLYLFLDSLDECLLSIKNISKLLLNSLNKLPIDRLYLRVTSRTAEWPISFEAGLFDLWGEENFQVYELAPLRRVDVIEAAEKNNLDSEKFIEELIEIEVVPLAIKPLTLKFLINNYIKNSSLPSTKKELYKDGCELLCSEHNSDSPYSDPGSSLSPEQKILIAGRIAVATIFSNKSAINLNLDYGDIPEEDLKLSELSGYTERYDTNNFHVDSESIKQTLSSGLFSSRGPNRMGWAHKTYSEYLAAYYIALKQMDIKQILSLMLNPIDPEGRIVPNLNETAAWIATMNPEFYKILMEIDPEILLYSDIYSSSSSDRKNLVSILLEKYNKRELFDDDFKMRKLYRKLYYTGLSDDLRQVFLDKDKDLIARRVAISIVEECELSDVQEELLSLTFDPNEHYQIQQEAAYALVRVGNESTKYKLKPLTIGVDYDLDDQLKGIALECLFPDFIDISELSKCLDFPKHSRFFGDYYTFIFNLPEKIDVTDLPALLKWAAGHIDENPTENDLDHLIDAILFRAFKECSDTIILKELATTIISRLKTYRKAFDNAVYEKMDELLLESPENRKNLVSEIVSQMSQPDIDSFALVLAKPNLVYMDDIPWMISELENTEDANEQISWATLIKHRWDVDKGKYNDQILICCENSKVLKDVLSYYCDSVEINSDKADELRNSHEEFNRYNDDVAPHKLEPPPRERVRLDLESIESGNYQLWWQLSRDLSLNSNSTHYGHEIEPDITNMDGWKEANSSTRLRIIEAAKIYISNCNLETDKWINTSSISYDALAAYKAVYLLFKEDNDYLEEISLDNWIDLAGIMVAFPYTLDLSLQSELLKITYNKAPNEVIRVLLCVIDRECEEHNKTFIVDKLTAIEDEKLFSSLLNKIKEENLSPLCMGALLSFLLGKNYTEAREYGEILLEKYEESDESYLRAAISAISLVNNTPDSSWFKIWNIIQQSPDFGKDIFNAEFSKFENISGNVCYNLSTDELSDLYIWLEQNYPFSESPDHPSTYWVGPLDNLYGLKNWIINYLSGLGSYESCDALEKIKYYCPELTSLDYTIHQAKNLARQSTWIPTDLKYILKLFSNKNSRIIENGYHLNEVVIESLNRLQKKLHDETPAVADLWNQIPASKGNPKNRPKNETHLSDYVKRHFKDDLIANGIIANREVEIQSRLGEIKGQEPDIKIDAIALSGDDVNFETISLLIEVKGCWNKELFEAMKTQLVERYLKNNSSEFGIYLVGWFYCSSWDNEDYRKKDTKNLCEDIDNLQEELINQAVELSAPNLYINAYILDATIK